MRKLFTPNSLCIIALILLASAQTAVLFAKFWPWHAGLAALGAWIAVLAGVAVVYAVVAILIFSAWVRRGKLRDRGWLKSATWLFVLLPLANAIYLGWWPTAERLAQAAGAGQIAVVERCLFWGIDPNATYVQAAGFGGRSETAPALVHAAGGRHLAIVKLLLDAGADIDANHNGALRAAIHSGAIHVVEHLLRRGANADGILDDVLAPGFGDVPRTLPSAEVLLRLRPEVVDSPRPLLVAAHVSRPEIARLLAGVDVQQRYGPVYELLRAVVSGDRDQALSLYAQVQARLPKPTNEDDRLRALSSFAGLSQLPDEPLDMVNGETLLSIAAGFGAADLAAGIIAAATPVDPPIDRHRTLQGPLHRAVWNDHLETAAVLLRAGADAMRVNRDLGTPLHAAVVRESSQMIELLLDAGADIDAPRSDILGETAVMTAIRIDNVPLVRLLVERGANLSLRDERGFTACDQVRNPGELSEFMARQHCGS